MSVRTCAWIGLAEVTPGRECDLLKQGHAAFVPVVAKAPNAQAFYEVVKSELKALQLELIRMEDGEHLSERRRKHRLPDDLETAIEGLSSAHRLAFGRLHSFRNFDSSQRQAEDHQ
jgi:hypothetical protein